ncbi:universal stress protein PHOS34-like [Phalaenopsis equestris]|uniref:universal stress protein PHOS34-like n=1 Tax=Phalaenopsis equestris TaxID=78828 RepID=UPI0009E2FA91|nr:universal stress protein PHOS34-like [Phalaenopsis equestris]
MAAEAAEGSAELKRGAIVVGIDDSEHSFYALQWILRRFFFGGSNVSPLGADYKLIVIHAKPLPSSVIGIGGPGVADVLPYVELDLKRIATEVIEKARKLCVANLVRDVIFEVAEGDARNILCDAVEKFNADVLVVGSHGYGAIKRAVLGSVSDYCAHHAHCTVMIVKEPKHKH